MKTLRPFVTAALLLTCTLAVFGFLGTATQGSEIARSIWPSLVAAICVLAPTAWFLGRRVPAAVSGVIGLVLIAVLFPSYTGGGEEFADPDATVVWANVLKQPEAFARVMTIAEREGASFVVIGEAPNRVKAPEGWHIRCPAQPVLMLTRDEGPNCDILHSEHRGAARLAIEIAGSPAELFAIHAPMPLRANAVRRREEELAALRASLPTNRPAIVVGDFNAPPWSAAIGHLEDAGLRRLPYGLSTTWLLPVPFLGLPIDHAFVSGAVDASVRVGPFVGSDHRPLVAKIRLQG